VSIVARRWLTVALLSAWTHGFALWMAYPVGHDCSDHVCLCPSHRSAAQSSADCHGHERHGPQMRGACSHPEPAPPLTIKPMLLPEPPLSADAALGRPAPLFRSAEPRIGFLRRVLPPPRSA